MTEMKIALSIEEAAGTYQKGYSGIIYDSQ